MKHSVRTIVVVTFGLLTSASLVTAQPVSVGRAGLGVPPAPKLPKPLTGTLICRGGPELVWEGPIEFEEWDDQAKAVKPKRKVIGLIFQIAPGPAGPQGLGLKQGSECGFMDRPWPAGVPQRIYMDAASTEFDIRSGTSGTFARRSSIQEYLRDVNHFWAFTGEQKSFYFNTEKHGYLEATAGNAVQVPILTRAENTPGNVLEKAAPKQATAAQPGSASASAAETRTRETPSSPTSIQSGGAVPSAARDKAQPPAKPFSVPPQAGGTGSQTPGETVAPNPQPLPPKDTPIQTGAKVLPNPVDKAGLNPQPLPPGTPVAGEKPLPGPVERGVTPATERMTPAQVDTGLDPVPVGQAVIKPAEKVDIGVRTSSTTVSPGDRIAGSSAETVERAGSIAPKVRIAADPTSVEFRINAGPDTQMAVLLFDHPPRHAADGTRGWPGPPLGAGQGKRAAGSSDLVFSSQSRGIRLEPARRYYYVITVTPGGGVHHGQFETPPSNVAPADAIAGSSAVTANTAAAATAEAAGRTASLPANLFEMDDRAIIIVGGKQTTAGEVKREIDAELQRAAGPPTILAVKPRRAIELQKADTRLTPEAVRPRSAQPVQGQAMAEAAGLKMDCMRNWPRISNIHGPITPASPFRINGTCFGNEAGTVEIVAVPNVDVHEWTDTYIVAVVRAPVAGVLDGPIAVSVRRTGDRRQSVVKEASFIATRERFEVPGHYWLPSSRFTYGRKREVGYVSVVFFSGWDRRSEDGQSVAAFHLRVNPACTLDNMDAVAARGAVRSISGWDVGAPHEANVKVNWEPLCIHKKFDHVLGKDEEWVCTIDFTVRAWAFCPAGLKP